MFNKGGTPKILKRSTRHLIPIEVNCNDESEVPLMADSNFNEDSLDPFWQLANIVGNS